MAALKNQALIGLVIVIILGGAYLFFFSGGSPSTASVTEVTANSAQNTFTSLLAQLEPITFDAQSLSDPRFLSLTDLTTPVNSEPLGRTDPFASLPGVSQ